MQAGLHVVQSRVLGNALRYLRGGCGVRTTNDAFAYGHYRAYGGGGRNYRSCYRAPMKTCKATLPSADCAFDFLDAPSPKTVAGLVVTTCFRGSLIAAGAYVFGVRDPKVLIAA